MTNAQQSLCRMIIILLGDHRKRYTFPITRTIGVSLLHNRYAFNGNRALQIQVW